MRTAMTLEQAKAEVCDLLRDLEGTDPETKIEIHLWFDGSFVDAPPCVGVRVDEVSFVSYPPGGGMCGASWMGAQPEVLGIFAAIERCIIERMFPCYSEEEWDNEVADADWRLKFIIKEGKE
jgi:hypothetical protein